MKIRLLKPARVNLAAGAVIETDPAQAGFLLAVGSAEAVTEEPQEKPKKTRKSAEK